MLQAECHHYQRIDTAPVSQSSCVFPSVCRGTDFQTASHVCQELLLPDVFEACKKVRSATFPPQQSAQHQNLAVPAIFS